ncbi:beta-glucosidase BglX [Brevundimonas nasdae]|uniref:beta-glucosidase BglX n=1 Tax=Brevundimonas nasdae TaxID=172043 RepID=UPI000B2C3A5B|nr:beta-glucosidase BglX [Brevundimonas nasdae]
MPSFEIAEMKSVLASVSLAALVTTACLASPSLAQSPVALASQAVPAEAVVRANALIARMTLEEKAGQVTQLFMFGKPEDFEAGVRAGSTGALLFVTDPTLINRFQKVAVEESRLGIPLLFGYDVIHGLRTIFPAPIGMAASWDPAALERGQTVAAAEARASGIHWTFAPMLDVTRDPRWGRIVEGPGEDPYLGAALARAAVRGFQGDRIGAPGRIIAGAKHFAVYGASEGGRDYDSVFVSDSQFYNTYLPPFAAAIEAGAGNVMSAYMELNDVPAAANAWLLTDVLRRQLGFQGFVVSDANGVKSLVTQGYAADERDAAVRALTAGGDLEMAIAPAANSGLAEAVRSGTLEESVLDDAVRRVLIAKIRMGLFENPYVDASKTETVLSDPAHRQEARDAAEKSLVLLQNTGSILPLTPGAHRRIAVIGPMADSVDDTLGSWVFVPKYEETVTLAEGIRRRVGADVEVTTAPGVQLRRGVPSMFEMFRPSPAAWTSAQAQAEFERAVEEAREADIVILALGEGAMMSGEMASRADLSLPGDQLRLVEAVKALGKPIVAVLMNGRPLDIAPVASDVPAILEAWYPGTEGGVAVARALFGDVNPGGKLPMTWPRSVGQIPIYYSHNITKAPTEQGQRYWDEASTPLYPFGHGLSYTDFAFSDLSVDRASVAIGEPVVVTATVTNTGHRTGDEVAQLYIHQRSGRATRPVRELKGFQRVTLQPGESRRVQFELTRAELRYWSAAERDWVLDPATFDVWVGGDSRAQLATSFTVQP